MITMEICNIENVRGPGIWKLNCKILEDENYIEATNREIDLTLEECVSNKDNEIDTWERLKINCTKVAKNYSKNASNGKKQLLMNLYEYHTVMAEAEFSRGVQVAEENKLLIDSKVQELELEQMHSSVFRSRCTWAKHGERSSKYFFALEKRNFTNKTMFAVHLQNGEVCKNQKRILKEQRKFYEELYTRDEKVERFFPRIPVSI